MSLALPRSRAHLTALAGEIRKSTRQMLTLHANVEEIQRKRKRQAIIQQLGTTEKRVLEECRTQSLVRGSVGAIADTLTKLAKPQEPLPRRLESIRVRIDPDGSVKGIYGAFWKPDSKELTTEAFRELIKKFRNQTQEENPDLDETASSIVQKYFKEFYAKPT